MTIEESKNLSSLALDELIVKNFKKFFKRKGKFVRQPDEEKKSFRKRDDKKEKSDRKYFRCDDPNHLIGEFLKPQRNQNQKAFVGAVMLDSSHYSGNASSFDDDSMKIEYDNLCEISLKIVNKNRILKTKRDLLVKEILELNEKLKKLKRNKEVDTD
nr:zf-CCHC domain-containing protein/UBN2 domain-containing protein [Tanacetum cinerariifolium]